VKYGGWLLGGLGALWALSAYPLANSTFLHTEKYAVVTLIFLALLVRLVVMRLRRGAASDAPREETIAEAGVALALCAALLCCLLAPEPRLFRGTPAQSLDLGGEGLQALFPTGVVALDAPEAMRVSLIAASDRRLTMEGQRPLLLRDRILSAEPHVIATVEARGMGGDRLTVTQPLGTAFLSPMLTFPTTTEVLGLPLPSDFFTIPSLGRTVRAFLVTSELMRDPRVARVSGGRAGVLWAVEDASGRVLAHGIGFAADGSPLKLAGVVLTPHLGLFPALRVASVPEPMPMIIGVTAYVMGGATLVYRRRFRRR
jgi:hypothetical protein